MGMLAPDEKGKICSQAQTLQERLESSGRTESTLEDVTELIDEWCESLGGDKTTLDDRLRTDGIDCSEVELRLSAAHRPDSDSLPEWIQTLDTILVSVGNSATVDNEFSFERQISFVEILTPFLTYARSRVAERPRKYISEPAVDDLVQWLAERLERVLSHALFIEFKTYIATQDPDLVFDDSRASDPGATEYYDEFTELMLGDGLAGFFKEYAFAARLVVSILDQWIDRVSEFYARVSDDWNEIHTRLLCQEHPKRVTGIEAVGDSHHGGRAVLAVSFGSDATVAYKPRNSGLAKGFFDLVEWINTNSDLPSLQTLEIVCRQSYSWLEWITPISCSSETQIRDFYCRAGMLMCLFYALDATDLHLENIIARADQPVPIDLETLAQPTVRRKNQSTEPLVNLIRDTVLRTGTIPADDPLAEVDDMGGFSAQQAVVELEFQRFTDKNTDRMDLQTVQHPPRTGANLPRLDGSVMKPWDYSENIVRGFEELYRFILDHTDPILSEEGPVEQLFEMGASSRVLYRNTAVYSSILHHITDQSNLRTGLDFGVKAEMLAQPIVDGSVDEQIWRLYDAERRILQRFNTPRFTAEIGSKHIYGRDGVVVRDFFETSPAAQIRSRIEDFDETDLAEQTDYIKRGYGNFTRQGSDSLQRTVSPTNVDGVISAAETASRDIFDRITSHAQTGDKTPTWILRQTGPNGGLHVHTLADHLYEGRVGIGVFSAGLARTYRDEIYREFTRTLMDPLLTQIENGTFENDPSVPRSTLRPIGGATGLGSIVYGLTVIGRLLEDQRYFDAATRVASLVTPERIRATDDFEVLNGATGGALGMLSLYETTGDTNILDRAVQCGEHVLENSRARGDALVWPADDGIPLCGFSHGNAGIAYGLTRIGAVSGHSRFVDAAAAALRYEDELYDKSQNNWPDLRSESDTNWMDAWCHGRTGIGLSRLGMHMIDTPFSVHQDITNAAAGVSAESVATLDHVCCGNFGRVELLLQAEAVLGDSKYGQRAKRLAGSCIHRTDDAFTTQWQTDYWYNPTFYTGEAGIGYTLLRIVDPSLPSILLWE